MGFLDQLSSIADDPAKSQGLLQMGLSLLASKGNFGNALGNAGMAGIQGAQQYRQQDFQRKLQTDQLAQMQRQKQIQALPMQFATPAMKPETMDNRDVGQAGEGPVSPAGFDAGGYANALMGFDPMQAVQFRAAMGKPATKYGTTPQYDQNGNAFVLDEQGNQKYLQGVKARDKSEFVNGVAVNPYTQPGTLLPQDPNKPFGLGPDGKPSANELYQAYALKNSKAGAANTNIKIDNKLGEGLAKEVGPMVKESYDAAKGAQQAISNADMLIKALDGDKVFTGPGATLRLKGAQIAQTFGVAGKDDAEKIANTRSVIQGLAQSTLAARGQLKGQGQVSDFEGKLIERAAAGDVNDMTKEEIKQIAVVNQRLAKQVLSNHRQFTTKLKSNETTAGIANMFDLPEQAASGAQPAAGVDDLVNKYRTKE